MYVFSVYSTVDTTKIKKVTVFPVTTQASGSELISVAKASNDAGGKRNRNRNRKSCFAMKGLVGTLQLKYRRMNYCC